MKKRNTITTDQIDKILARTDFRVQTIYNKTTIVSAKLPNGFVIVEAFSCVDPANYNEKLGSKICKKRIINKIWELEGYKLQDEIYRNSHPRDITDYTIQELINKGYEVRIESDKPKMIIDYGRD